MVFLSRADYKLQFHDVPKSGTNYKLEAEKIHDVFGAIDLFLYFTKFLWNKYRNKSISQIFFAYNL